MPKSENLYQGKGGKSQRHTAWQGQRGDRNDRQLGVSYLILLSVTAEMGYETCLINDHSKRRYNQQWQQLAKS